MSNAFPNGHEAEQVFSRRAPVPDRQRGHMNFGVAFSARPQKIPRMIEAPAAAYSFREDMVRVAVADKTMAKTA